MDTESVRKSSRVSRRSIKAQEAYATTKPQSAEKRSGGRSAKTTKSTKTKGRNSKRDKKKPYTGLKLKLPEQDDQGEISEEPKEEKSETPDKKPAKTKSRGRPPKSKSRSNRERKSKPKPKVSENRRHCKRAFSRSPSPSYFDDIVAKCTQAANNAKLLARKRKLENEIAAQHTQEANNAKLLARKRKLEKDFNSGLPESLHYPRTLDIVEIRSQKDRLRTKAHHPQGLNEGGIVEEQMEEFDIEFQPTQELDQDSQGSNPQVLDQNPQQQNLDKVDQNQQDLDQNLFEDELDRVGPSEKHQRDGELDPNEELDREISPNNQLDKPNIETQQNSKTFVAAEEKEQNQLEEIREFDKKVAEVEDLNESVNQYEFDHCVDADTNYGLKDY